MSTAVGLDALASSPPVVAIRQAVEALPAADRPAYRSAGMLDRAPGHALARGPGLYLLLFDTPAGPRAYSGMTLDLRTRLLQHRRCALTLGISVPATGYSCHRSHPARRLPPGYAASSTACTVRCWLAITA